MDNTELRQYLIEVLNLSLKGVEVRFEAMDRALNLAGKEAERQYELLNHTRRDMVPDNVYSSQHKALCDKVEKNSKAISFGLGILLAVQTLIGIVVTIIVYLLRI